ncbi:hypothetical protein BLA60_31585 [Actinophytocola xinjiangensis]|uniref:Peptidase S8/S53 domain-containing protein n=1 Tax=Actinophytocola xinjiangensis TaxID=485602 RepID=A0A7Z0WG91_9PSEU|nr:S8 family serine peptidase [Actinophytocola xinjiangensis]OLF06510.1 hypothetical protein BLA60_31585 [Actinophytocola xinjiangensis]
MRIVITLTAAAVALSGLPAPATATTTPTGTVTLITGDRVVLGEHDEVLDVLPGAGREHVPIHVLRRDGTTHVVPDDAARRLATDRLDPRLFDVALLRASGYRDTVPLLVEGPTAGLTVHRRLPGLTSVHTDGRDWSALGAARKVWLDGRRHVSLDRSVPRIGAPAAWAAGLTGAGVTVAVLDTGVDQTHPDLAGREVAEANFSDSPDNTDRAGHGTHVASTVAGAGERYRGVAPGARLLDGKVLDDNGWGSDSSIITGMEWAAEHGARIVNLSLGGEDTPGIDPLEQTVNRLSAEHGMLFVTAAGNSYRPRTIDSPASAAAALAVSAVDLDGVVADFASRGPGLDNVVKPEITAPGVDITAAAPGGGYETMSGTSMAAPHVSGAAALLAEKHPGWTGERLRTALTGSAVPTSDADVFSQGAGQVDVPRALSAGVYATPATLDFGVERWPHDGPVTRTLTYHNDGDTEITLDLAVAGFALGAERVRVPAGGSAPVTVTAAPGTSSGTIVASADGMSVRTPVGVEWEPESYDVTIEVIGPDGRPATNYDVLRMGFGEIGFEFLYDPDGTVETRMRAGLTPVKATVRDPETGRYLLVTHPGLTVSRDTRITLDARTARPVDVTLPEDVSPDGFDIGYAAKRPNGESNSHSVMFGSPADLAVAHAGPVLDDDSVITWMTGQWGDLRYNLSWFLLGRASTGLTETVRRSDLAEITLRLVPAAPGALGALLLRPSPPGGFDPIHDGAPMGVRVDLPELPADRVVHVNSGAEWSASLDQETSGGATVLTTGERHYLAGRAYRLTLGHPVIGPALPPSRHAMPGVSRTGDWLTAAIPLFGDTAGNTGDSTYDSGHSALHRDGSLIDEQPWAGGGQYLVPPEPGTYRLTTTATRSGFPTSTRVDAAWTFRSAHTPDSRRIPLPTLGFRPAVTEDGTAPAGRFTVPVVLTGADGRPVRPHRLTVAVSHDDGASWRAVPVVGGAVRLDQPAGGAVSLRASARTGDTSVEVTIVRAYLVAGGAG